MKVLNLRFYKDPEAGLPHIYKHDISEDEVEDILLHPGEDRAGREGSRVAIGKTAHGRYLRIIYVPDVLLKGDFIITAYELTGKPLTAFRKRLRKKGKK